MDFFTFICKYNFNKYKFIRPTNSLLHCIASFTK